MTADATFVFGIPLAKLLVGAEPNFSAVSMQSEVTPALTLTLSPRRGNRPWPRRKKSSNGEPIPALEKVLPLPGGEGRGEGEGESQLNSYGFDHSSFRLLSSFVIRHLEQG